MKDDTALRARPRVPLTEQAKAMIRPPEDRPSSPWHVSPVSRLEAWRRVEALPRDPQTPADVRRSLDCRWLCGTLDHRRAMQAETEALAYPDDWHRRPAEPVEVTPDGLRLPGASLPDVIRFAYATCRYAERDGVPLFPDSYWRSTVTLHHLAWCDFLNDAQWAVVVGYASRAARALDLRMEFEPFGHFTVYRSRSSR